MYSGWDSVVMRYKFEMSIAINHTPFVEMTLLNNSVAISISTVGVATSPS